MLRTLAGWWNQGISRWPAQSSQQSRRRRNYAAPVIERLEDRIVLAHNLAIDAVDTAEVSVEDVGAERIFTALTDSAVVNVADIQAAFEAGLDVVISTGTGGGSTGDIDWRAGADLYVSGFDEFPAYLRLTLQTDELDTSRNVNLSSSLSGYPSASSPFRSLVIQTGGPGGAVTLQQVAVNGGVLSVTSGEAGIFLHGDLNSFGGDIQMFGDVLLENNVLINTTQGIYDFWDGNLRISGTIDGHGSPRDLSIDVGTGSIMLKGDLGVVEQQLANLTVTG